jgi:CBS domain containing-hemolysin-like protein
MSADWFNFLISFFAVGTMLLLHGYIVMAEISLIKVRYGEVEDDVVEQLMKRRGIASLIENGDLTGRVVRFSKTLCTVALGLLLIPWVGDLFALVNVDSGQNRWLLVFVAFAFAVSVHFFFAEIFPRGLAMKDPVRSLQRSYRVLFAFRVLTYPLMFVFRGLKRVLFRWMGVDMEDEFNPLDLDVQIRAMGEDSTLISEGVRKIINRTMQMQDLVVHDVLLPRSQVVICDLEDGIKVNLDRMKTAGHTRFPLCRGSLDDCVGMIHIKDIFRWREPVSGIDLFKLKRSIATFPLDTPLEDAMDRMLRAKFHMALAVDEFGGVIGVITLESIIEEMIGEIQDEFDSEEAQIVKLADGTYKISGLAPIHDIEEELEVEIANEEASTFGGLITGELGRIPDKSETLESSGLQITIEQVDERRVISARVEVL